jgi:hypothetical protein
MAGSYQHCIDESGQLLEEPLLDHMGDAREAIEHMHYMIQVLSEGDGARIKAASEEAYARIAAAQEPHDAR